MDLEGKPAGAWSVWKPIPYTNPIGHIDQRDCTGVLPDRVFYAPTVTSDMTEFYPTCRPRVVHKHQTSGTKKIGPRMDPESALGLPDPHPQNAVHTSVARLQKVG